MNLLCWNCRGLGKPRAVRELTELVRFHKPSVVGLIETKVDRKLIDQYRVRLGFQNGLIVDRRGLAGGLALWWKDEIELQILNYTNFHIDALIKEESQFRATLFYGSPYSANRRWSWSLLKQLGTFNSFPWIIFGDFNEVCFSWEVKGGRVRGEWQMRSFREALDSCNLVDLGHRGNPFTFSNRRAGDKEMRARLDRALATSDWIKNFPNYQVHNLETISSDHAAILIELSHPDRRRNSSLFRFEPMWFRSREFSELVACSWPLVADSNQNLTDSLNLLGAKIGEWNSQHYGNVTRRIKNMKKELEYVRSLDRTEEVIEREVVLTGELDEWRLREELLWKQRSRVDWLKEGDKNTKYFHFRASQRRRRNYISKLLNDQGEWITDEEDIKATAKKYFSDIFKSRWRWDFIDGSDPFHHIQARLSLEAINTLMQPFTGLEVQAAIFQIYPTKAPGPDGFSAIFFQKCWNVVKADLTRRIITMLEKGKLEPGINDTVITLVPKIKSPQKIEDFRPISLCNVTAKIITKILANRLKRILPSVISDYQSAFVPGRLISDNFILAHELTHFIRTRRNQKFGYMSLKTDMSKAYDRMEWPFLENMLISLGFPEKWVSLIMECVSTVKYKVKINNQLTDHIQPSRGLRQGDPLSPYLFLLCAEWLSRSISKLEENRSIKGVKVSRGAPSISHLFFADDSIFFLKATYRNVQALKNLLDWYQQLSGQKINYVKSEVSFSSNVSEGIKREILSLLGVHEVAVHTKYLGLPLVCGQNRSEMFKFIIERVWKRCSSWKEKFLSSAGKEVLIKAIIQAIPLYVMSCFELPDSVCKRIFGIVARFWWSNNLDKKPIYWTNQTQLCNAKEIGGMNFRDMKLFNKALLAKQAWRLVTNPASLVSAVLKAKYYPNTDFLNSQVGTIPSSVWRFIWKAGMEVKQWIDVSEPDRPRWTLESNGVFSTKTAYKALKNKKELAIINARGETSNNSAITMFWRKLWRLKVQNKVKIFVWKLANNYIPVALNLIRRGCSMEMRCQKRTGLEEVKLDGSALRDKVKMSSSSGGFEVSKREMGTVLESMRSVITMKKTEFPDSVLDDFSEGYLSLSDGDKRNLLLVLAKDYDCDRASVRELMKLYLGLEVSSGDKDQTTGPEDDVKFSAFYRTEKNLRQALKPTYELLFDRLNTHKGGLKFLTILRADVLSILREENIASLRALDADLKEKLITWLSPAVLELHQLTWNDSASLLEKIVAYEAVHPISSLVDLKRRLGVGRRCFGYFHPGIPGEPLIFIEVALLRKIAETIQEVLWDEPPIPEHEATCALFYSISSTQPGLAGINLGKFLIKRVVTLLRRDMPHISTFATLSPIPGFMQWLLSKLASQSKLSEAEGIPHSSEENTSSTFQENILEPAEENALSSLSVDGRNGMEKMLNLFLNTNKWTSSDELLAVLKTPLMRLCARYLLLEKKRGKALDSVANFHLQNGAMVERINWMADKSEKGLSQSGGIMVNYVYRLENIEDYAQSYFTSGTIHASTDVRKYIQDDHISSKE